MFETLGRVIYRRRRWMVSLALLLVAGAAVCGTGVFGRLTVRSLLVPATMRLPGRADWYAAGPLRRFYARYGIRENDAPRRPPSDPPWSG